MKERKDIRQIRLIGHIGLMGHIRLMGLIGLICLMGSCSGNDVPEPTQQKAIGFAGNMQKEAAVTRADKGLEDVLDPNNKAFNVWAYKNTAMSGDEYTDYQTVMTNYAVVYETSTGSDSNTHDWEYVGKGPNQSIKYWDFAAYAYRFFGYALGKGTTPSPVTVTPSEDKVTVTSSVDGSNNEAAPFFSELWFSNDKVNDYGKVVKLSFFRPFARVRFMFTFMEGCDFGREALSEIKFRPNPVGSTTPTIATAGDVTVTYPLKGTDTKETCSIVTTGSVEAFDIDWYTMPASSDIPDDVPADDLPATWPNTPEKWYYVLPTDNQGSYKVEVKVLAGDIKEASVPAEYMVWKMGYEYTYVFKITDRGVAIDVIQVAVNNWDEKGNIQHPVYNW